MSRVSPVVLFVWLALAACASSGANRGPGTLGDVNLVGLWSETWAPGEATDVDYHDVYAIVRGDDGALIGSCPARPSYQFPRVEVAGGKLHVRVVNDDGGGDPTVIDYTLAPRGDRQLVGRARTNHGIDVPIVWDRAE